jgi:flagellar biosynthesis chaperone FliJ
MNEKLDKCCSRLKEEINTVELGIAKVGHHLSSAANKGVDTLEADLKKATANCEAKREQAEHAGQRIRQFIEEAKKNTVAKLEEWKTDRKIEKIEKHADKKEQQAVDAIVVAEFALLEAEVIIVDALKARNMAVEVAG